MIYTVRLKSGTIGTIDSDTLDSQSAEAFIGEVVNVHLQTEAEFVEEEGVLVEILDSCENWQ